MAGRGGAAQGWRRASPSRSIRGRPICPFGPTRWIATASKIEKEVGRARHEDGSGLDRRAVRNAWARVAIRTAAAGARCCNGAMTTGASTSSHVADADLHGEPAALCAELAARRLADRPATRQRDFVGYLSAVRHVSAASTSSRGRAGMKSAAGVFSFCRAKRSGRRGGERVILDAAAHGPYEARGTIEDWRDGVGAARERPCLARAGDFRRAGGAAVASRRASRAAASISSGNRRKGKTTMLQTGGERLGARRDAWLCPRVARDGERLRRRGGGRDRYRAHPRRNGQVDARDMAAALYSLANGAGKARAARDGGLREPKSVARADDFERRSSGRREAVRGSRPKNARRAIGAHVGHSRRRAPSACSIMPGRTATRRRLAKACKLAAMSAYGTAGPEFVRRLIARRRDRRRRARDGQRFRRGGSPARRGRSNRSRVRNGSGLIAAAGELATAFGFTPWREGEAREAAAWALEQWIEGRGGTEPAEVRQAVEQVRLSIEAHGEGRFDRSTIPKPSPSTIAPAGARARARSANGGFRRKLGKRRFAPASIRNSWRACLPSAACCAGKAATPAMYG